MLASVAITLSVKHSSADSATSYVFQTQLLVYLVLRFSSLFFYFIFNMLKYGFSSCMSRFSFSAVIFFCLFLIPAKFFVK